MNTITLNDFFADCDRELFQKAIDHLKENPGTCLKVPPRTYEISTKKARDAQAGVMNGNFTDDPQSIMFRPEYDYDIGLDFKGLTDCTVDAEGATLLIDGFMEPVCVRACEGVTVSGFTILHKRKPYSKGTVVSAEALSAGTYRSLIELWVNHKH